MSDHNFEKQIQQKLNELKIPPAERVWSAVEAEIRNDKRRRRGLIIFPLLLLLLAGGSYFIYQNMLSSNTTTGSKSYTVNTDSHNNDSISESSKESQEQVIHDQKRDKNNHQDRQQITSGVPGSTAETSYNEELSQKVSGPEQKLSKKDNAINYPKKNTVIDNKPPRDKSKSQQDIITTRVVVDQNLSKKSAALTIDGKENERKPAEAKQDERTATTDKAIEFTPDSLTANAVAATAATTGDRTADSAKNPVQQKPVDSVSSNTMAQEKKQANKNTKQSNWKWGANAAAGISNFQEGSFFDNVIGNFFGTEKSLVADVSANSTSNANGPPVTVHQPSTIEKGFSFSIGGFTQKNLSKRFSISTGIQYSYYSTNIQIGSLVDSSRMVQSAFGSLNISQYYQAAPMPSTNRYKNKFHFIELPVQAHFQLNKGNRLPVFWNSGLSVSYLVSTNALHFDGLTGVYYKDNELFNKVQANLTTGFSVSLWNTSKTPVNVGPHIQYGFTNLMKREVSTSTHLFYFGLNAKIFLKK